MELLEALKSEYESMYQELNVNKLQHENEHKCNCIKILSWSLCLVHSQLVDILSLQRALYELERSHLKMKQQ